ncbi:MAG: hypothetical protein OSB02_06705 [Rhodospirillaceae bacterium]|jgi:hypothetical protein|nr:hypothetical protein [Rhodospirillaceae bacterium]
MAGASKPRQRTAKGRRPFFLDTADSDKLLAMVTALVGEVSVLKDRVDTHERLAAAGTVATPEEIEGYRPDDAVEDEREAGRAGMLDRVFRIISAANDPNVASEAEYDSLVDRFSNDDKGS